MPASRFITLSLIDTDNTMRNINPFHLQKSLDSIAGNVKNASLLKNETLMVEVQNGKKAGVLLKANVLVLSYPVPLERHISLNSSQKSLTLILFMACRTKRSCLL